MTVFNAYSQDGGLKGGSSGVLTQYFDVAVDGAVIAAGDVIKLAPMTGTMVPVAVNIYTPAGGLAGATDVDLGFYKSSLHGDEVLDADALGDGLDLSGLEATVDGLTLANADRNKDIRTLVNANPAQTEYDLALTFNSEVTASGTLKVEVLYYTNA